MDKALLPRGFRYTTPADLIRLGRAHDGGYLVSRSDIAATELLIGLGINDDWSFEADFCSHKNVPVRAYDGSISKADFLKQFIKALPRLDDPKMLTSPLRAYFGYNSFFSGTRSHVRKFVGIRSDASNCLMSEVLQEAASDRIFLKIDIEGSEYRILDDLVAQQQRFTGAVIEFHDCDLHLGRIEEFIRNFALRLVHLHANNYLPVSAGHIPLCLELTFSSHAVDGAPVTLPHRLDMPNDPRRGEIVISVSAV